ncbi:MAG: S16 family serine protease [archaeon]|nr:S16 family serine protease [archaeon]
MAKNSLFLVFLLLFSATAFALVSDQHIKVLAVTSNGQGLTADLFLRVEPTGDGTVWVAAKPLVGTTTQSAAQTAVELAKNYSSDVKNHDYKFSIESTASVVEGPSAGAAMALVVISAFEDKKIPLNVAVTGTIDGEGNVGQVGGVFEKTKEAAKQGIDLFLIPKGEAIQTIREDGVVQSINLVEYGPTQLGMKVIEVATIDEVIKYAFSDIEKINIDEIIAQSEIPEFVPQQITYGEHLQPMKELVNNYVDETKVIIDESRNAVSTALINDQVVLNTLLELLNNSESLVREAEILNTQNYLYSAANFSFLARVNALTAKDIATNPSLLSLNSTALEVKINGLNKEINAFEDILESNMPFEGMEWFVSAQERLSYAKLNIEKLSNTQTVIVDGTDSPEVALERVFEYEFAVAWVDVAKDFESISQSSQRFVRPDSKFKELSEKLVTEAETALSTLPVDFDVSDIERRLNGAKLENSKEWFIAGAVDAATAKALATSEVLTFDKSLEELSQLLAQKISALEKNIDSSSHVFSWAPLYLAHSKYFLEASKYYSESGETSRAVGALRSGISLISIAEEIFAVMGQVYTHYDGATDFIPGNRNGNTGNGGTLVFPPLGGKTSDSVKTSGQLNPVVSLLFAGAIFFAGFVFVFFVFRHFGMGGTGAPVIHSYNKQLETFKSLKLKADSALLAGKLSEEKHSELAESYKKEIAHLEHSKDSHASAIIEMDDARTNLQSLEKKMRQLKQHAKTGMLSEKAFEEKKKKISTEIASLEGKISGKTTFPKKARKKAKKKAKKTVQASKE